MTLERYNEINNEIEKIRSCDRLNDSEMAEEEMFVFESRHEFEEYAAIENGEARPLTKQDRLEEIADARYNASKEA